MKLIWYWDREITLTGDSLVKTTHCFGWQETIGDKTIKVIVHLNPYTNVVQLERSWNKEACICMPFFNYKII